MREKKYAVHSNEIACYVEDLLQVEKDDELEFVLQQAKKFGTPPLQMTPVDARHLQVICQMIRPQKVVEIGTLCGYSAVNLSRGLAPGGVIYTCEKSEHHIKVASHVFSQLKLEEKIKLVPGEALESLKSLSQNGPFDMVFIDADKDNYPNYFEWAVNNLRSGGVLVADNVFLFGHIASPCEDRLGEMAAAMKLFNEKCASDKRFLTTFFPTGEGLLVAVKK